MELDEKIETLIYQGSKNTIQIHIEGIHFEGISIPCNLCGTTLKTRDSFKRHNARSHKDNNWWFSLGPQLDRRFIIETINILINTLLFPCWCLCVCTNKKNFSTFLLLFLTAVETNYFCTFNSKESFQAHTKRFESWWIEKYGHCKSFWVSSQF